jgi:hypothetical protein
LFGEGINSKDICPTLSPDFTYPDYYLWGAVNGAVYKDNPHTLLELEEAIAISIRNIAPIQLSRVFAKQDETCKCVSTSMCGPFLTFVVTEVSMRNVFTNSNTEAVLSFVL